jgi:hypothetical protein
LTPATPSAHSLLLPRALQALALCSGYSPELQSLLLCIHGGAAPLAAIVTVRAWGDSEGGRCHAWQLLCTPPPTAPAPQELAPRLLIELGAAHDASDCLAHLLAREADNGRLLRLAIKLGMVNERPTYDGDPSWAETGDCYLLKLFRDFVFHQVCVQGG